MPRSLILFVSHSRETGSLSSGSELEIWTGSSVISQHLDTTLLCQLTLTGSSVITKHLDKIPPAQLWSQASSPQL